MSEKMKYGYIFNYLCLIVVTVILTSCNVTRAYQSPEELPPNLYRDMQGDDTASLGTLTWKEVFTDSTLQQLIQAGLDNNPDILMAIQRIQQAEYYYQQSSAAFQPTLDANLNAGVSKLSEAQGFGIRTSAQQYQLGISSSWEADIWGKLRSGKRASLANLLQTQAVSDAVRTRIVSNIANLYYGLMGLDSQLDITRQTVENWDATVQTMRDLKTAAIVTEAAVVQSEAQRYAAAVTIPDLQQRIYELENALKLLLGSEPGPISRNSLYAQQTPNNMEAGVPTTLLANRPDVKVAEYNYRYFYEMTNVARTYFYPSLILSASAGLNALSIDNFFSASNVVGNLGAGLAQPILNRKVNETRLKVAESQQEEAYIGFKNTLLLAGAEVSDALMLFKTSSDKTAIRNGQLEALKKSVDYSNELLRYGFANYTEIITARQSLLQAELGAVNDRMMQLQATVDLYRALGGGWK